MRPAVRSKAGQRLHFALAHQLFERFGYPAGKTVFFDLMPIGCFDRAARGADARETAAGPIDALLMSRRVVIDEYPLGLEFGEFLIAVIAQKQRLAAVAHEYDRAVRNPDFRHEPSIGIT